MNTALVTFAGLAFVAVCGLAGTLGASWISRRATDQAAKRAAELQERTVNREEFDSITRQLNLDVQRLRDDLAHEHDARIRAEQRAEDADTRAATAAAKATRLERRITQLEEVLRAHDMPVPPPLP